MARVVFTQNLLRHLPCPPSAVTGETVHDALANVFKEHPTLEGYILDEQGRLRKHVTIFVDGTMIADRLRLSDPIKPDSEVYVLQALSGG